MRPPAALLVPALWLALLGLTIALSALAAVHPRLPGDAAILTWAQDLPFPGQPLSDAVRAATGTQVVMGTGYGVAVLLWLRGHRRQAILLAAGLTVLPFLQTGIKALVDRPRPAPPLVELRAGFSSPSFPSGHVMSPAYLYGFFLYLTWTLPLPVWARAALSAWSLFLLAFTGPVNVYLGVHWPSDVLGGYAWGLLLLTPFLWAERTLSRRPPFPGTFTSPS